MLEDEKLGLKVAENASEELWTKYVEAQKENLKRVKQEIEIFEEHVKMGERKLEEVQKDNVAKKG